jgi:hypothetical protein
MVLQMTNGYPEVILVGKCNTTVFHATAEWLQQKIGISYEKQSEQDEQILWEFNYSGRQALLRYDREKGIDLCPAQYQQQATTEDLVAFDQLMNALQSL